jgi:ABC-type polar amino acid transport system ATPase subunit
MSIRVVDLEKRHPGSGEPALRGLSMHVPAGQVASVLGKSGAGKTTLLRCLVGLDPFDRGSIEIDGVTVTAGAASRTTPRMLGRVGLVFQSFELFPHLSVLDNCTLAPVRAQGKPRAAAEKLALELLDRLGLADKAGAFPEALSGGQRQRVAIARALAVEPRVLLYDEPTSALDPSLKQEVGRSLRRVAATGITQILVTHDLEVAREASDVVFVLEAGRVARSGPPAEVLAAGTGEDAA